MAARKGVISGNEWDEDTLRELISSYLAEKLEIATDEIDPAKAFDEYGLDSVDAVIATAAIGERLDVELAPELLFEHRTVNAVVQALLDYNPGGVRKIADTPVFLFPGGGGRDEPALVRLRARSLPHIRFVLVSVGDWRKWMKDDLDFDGLAGLAAQFIEESEGPIRLAGYSQGGQLAYATALALEQRGRGVRWIGLLDSGVPRAPESRLTRIGFRKGIVQPAWDYLTARLHGKDLSLVAEGDPRIRILNWLWDLNYGPQLVMGMARIGGPLLRARSVVRLDHYIQIRLFSKMSEDWSSNKRRPSALDVPVFLFLPEQVFPQSEDVADDRGWRSLCSDLRIVPAAGDHFTMLGSKHIDDLITNIVEAKNSVK